ncbi:TRICHOME BIREFRINGENCE-LIKE 5 [Perilla frutescens var. hirtella]|uniref:TRICHOME BIREFRINGENCE-LIKE 5 n=1 Tax=Perilla frutescens var. hirtella TaxID=608512 RepID=A0AAD4P0Q2_PERFH|nr:TRICHOME BIREFRINGENCE-LIKE 5 [Perilla frutescens var. hirtella]
MATSSSNFTKKFNRYKLLTLSLILLSLFCVFLFNRRDLNLISQSPASLLVSGSPQSYDKLGDLRQPIPLSSDLQENADGNVTAFSRLTEPEPKEDLNVETTAPVSSNLDLDDETPQKTPEQSVSSEPELEDDYGTIGEAESSNVVHVSSNPNHDDETPQKTSEPSVSSEPGSEDDSGERKGEPEFLNDVKIVPFIPKSDFDDRKSGKLEGSGVKEESLIEVASSDAETGGVIDDAVAEKLRNCDIYKGTWAKDEGYPVYKPGSCPYVDEGFDCQSNGRPDSAYTQWRWKPDGCELPRFNATDFLVRLRGKRLMLVGDSMNRNQFESLLCLLREGLPDKSKMYETRGNKITKGRGYFIFKFVDYDCTVEFVRSHFLVREGIRMNAQGNSNPTLAIDRIDKTATRWLRADILVFNTGHWWSHGKTSRGKNYYKEGDYIHPKFDAAEAYRRAIKTWATWIKKNIKRDKLVFYRGYSSAHFRGGDWDSGGSCNGETEPVVQGAIIDSYPQKMTIVEEIIKETQVQAVLLNVTRLTNYRKDGHPSVYGKNVTRLKKVSTRRQDCSHWCLPGVPDAWNELIYATLVARQT